MAYGRPATVRSHRRGGPRRRLRVAPWIGVTLVSSLALSAIVFGYLQLVGQACSGEASARIIASPSTATLLEQLGSRWATTEPSIEGVCGKVTVEARDSAQMAAALSVEWDERTGGEPPDVWVPASTAWLQKASASDIAEPMMPDLRPSIARSPTVIAMPKAMADALDWPETDMQWQTLLDEFADDTEGWSKYGQPQWGEFRFGMSDPSRSTAGLLALSAILDSDDDGEISQDEARNVIKLNRLMGADIYYETTEQLMAEFETIAATDPDTALRHISAFPLLEQDVLVHNQRNASAPLRAIYPTNGNIEADHPYLVLNAPWVSEQARAVAHAFLAYVRGPEGQEALRSAGLRGPNRETSEQFGEQNGLVTELVALPRAVLVPDSVTRTLERWTALTRPTNMLMVLDVSGSMRLDVPGTSETRLQRAQDAAVKATELFPEDASVGLWEFSEALDGDLDHRTLVTLGRLDDVMEDSRLRRDHMFEQLGALTARGNTGLYNTIDAAYDTIMENYDENAVNMVVLMTDGADTVGGVALDDLVDKLSNPPDGRQIRVVTVGFGEEIDFEVLQRISETTGARAFRSLDGFDLDSVLLAAVFDNVL